MLKSGITVPSDASVRTLVEVYILSQPQNNLIRGAKLPVSNKRVTVAEALSTSSICQIGKLSLCEVFYVSSLK